MIGAAIVCRSRCRLVMTMTAAARHGGRVLRGGSHFRQRYAEDGKSISQDQQQGENRDWA